jgi:hypothetical protein
MNNKLVRLAMVLPMTFLVFSLTLMFATAAFAATATAGGSMEGLATSTQLTGTTDFYYSNEWLVRFVQFAISWLCIIALLVYYAGWLCSMVTLSNKELFYLIDSIKKDGQDGNSDGKGFGAITSVLKTFKNGAKDGVNGGLDNVLLFFLSLSINFKAYSYYKDVEAGSDGSDGKNKFNYNDTMLSFILKTLIPAIAITFVTSVAISGTLLGCWFTIGDVFIVRAERFSQTNLSAKVDSWIGDSAGYKFSLASTGTAGGKLGQNIAQKLYVQIASQFPNATAEQLQSLGRVIENRVVTDYLGNSPGGNYYSALQSKVKESQPVALRNNIVISNEQQAELVSVKTVVASTSSNTYNNQYTIYPVQDLINEAGLAPDGTNVKYQNNMYLRVLLGYDSGTASTMVLSTPSSSNSVIIK